MLDLGPYRGVPLTTRADIACTLDLFQDRSWLEENIHLEGHPERCRENVSVTHDGVTESYWDKHGTPYYPSPFSGLSAADLPGGTDGFCGDGGTGTRVR